MRFSWLIIPILYICGCGPSVRSYTINVQNNALEPMTLWLTKDGPPPELAWLSPEQIAMNDMKKSPIPGVVIPSGRSATMTQQTGHFDSGTHAVLRVYRGQRHFNNLLAIGDDSPNRTDLVLKPGANEVTIDQNGKPALK